MRGKQGTGSEIEIARYACYRTGQVIQVDGKLDEAAWASLVADTRRGS